MLHNFWIKKLAERFNFNRDYEKESERQAGVEEFYRINHINQSYDYVSCLFQVFLHFIEE